MLKYLFWFITYGDINSVKYFIMDFTLELLLYLIIEARCIIELFLKFHKSRSLRKGKSFHI